jgi:hypothetical protein
MAEGTRFNTIEKTLASLKIQQDEIKNRADLQEQKMDDIASKLDRLLSMGEKTFTRNLQEEAECSNPPRRPPYGSPQQYPDNNIQVRSIKVEFPKFEGENVSGWLFKANQFFSYNNTAPENRIFMASFYMEGEALVWFQDALDSGVFSSWEAFVKAIQIRFGPNSYDDPMEAITRLRQTSTVSLYKSQFEVVSNRLRGISEENRLSCFLSGLKDEIRLPLRMLNPTTLNDAFGLAKIQEEYVMSTRRPFRNGFSPNPNFQQGSNFFQGGQQPRAVSSGPVRPEIGNKGELGFPKGGVKQNLPIQKISQAQMEERRRKGLCYYCDEKYNPSHRCLKGKIYLMEGCELVQEEPVTNAEIDWGDQGHKELEEEDLWGFDQPEISLHAIIGLLIQEL